MMQNYTEQFCGAIRAAGLTPPDAVEADGKLRRFASNGKRADDSGWYVLHDGNVPAGAFGCWRLGVSETWRANIGRQLTDAEKQAHRARMDATRVEREAAESKLKDEARIKAAEIWRAARPALDDHAYLLRKGVKAHGLLRVHDGALVLRLLDTEGVLHSLQFISGDGEKRFLTGGRVTGCYAGLGEATGATALCIAEGYATGATIHEATGHPVALAFNAGNLLPVAKALKAKLPDLPLIVCADDDWHLDGNPGLAKATAAARSVGGPLAVPDFGPNRQDGETDFNDVARRLGLDAVRECIAAAKEGGEPGPKTYAATFPKPEDRPRFVVLDDWREVDGKRRRPGVYFCGMTEAKRGGEAVPFASWICSPLRIEAVTFDERDNNFGRLLRFSNSLGRSRAWAMPMELLGGDGSELRRELLSMGVEIDPAQRARNLLASYLQAERPKRRMRCALQVGWCGKSFVLPDVVIGPDAESVIYQSGERTRDEYGTGGTMDEWRDEIAARAVGNPLLIVALSVSFAGPMLARSNAESGGLHFTGDSSTGKTTAIEAACATWGGPGHKRSWKTTANGMEGAAALCSDSLLALDEISECDPREVGAIVYALGNGRGKQRASRSGAARGVVRWRCTVLSSGERTMETSMREAGQRAKAGQTVRLLDVPTARKYGAWDDLHGCQSGAAFSDGLRRAAATHYGHAGRAFLERLTRDERDFCALLERFKSLPGFSAEEGQHKRAAARLALIGMAGELATEYGLTGWPDGAAIEAAAECFRMWRSTRGKGTDERRQIVEQVSGFIERHGDGRFSSVDADPEKFPMRDRAGWWQDGNQGREYLFTAEGMREALKGFDFKRALDTLQEVGALPAPGADGKRARFHRIAGRGMKLYPVNADRLDGGDHA